LATKEVKKGAVKIGGETVKPSREVYPTDVLEVRKKQIHHRLEILDLPPSRVGAKLVGMYVKDLTPKEEYEKNELLSYAQDYYRKKGTGRPTKKDRRDLEDFTDTPHD
jgi:ribosome-associated heat shock protein Hsp15